MTRDVHRFTHRTVRIREGSIEAYRWYNILKEDREVVEDAFAMIWACAWDHCDGWFIPNLRWLKWRFYRTSIDKQTILGMYASFLLSTLNYVLYVWDIPSLYHAHTGRWPCLSNPNQQGMYMWMNQICEESPQRDWMIDDPHTWGLSNTTGELQTWIHTSEVTLEG
jgi:hypothetical protein